MQPLGLRPSRHNWPDNHPVKGYINWWEVEHINGYKKYQKKSARQRDRQFLRRKSVWR